MCPPHRHTCSVVALFRLSLASADRTEWRMAWRIRGSSAAGGGGSEPSGCCCCCCLALPPAGILRTNQLARPPSTVRAVPASLKEPERDEDGYESDEGPLYLLHGHYGLCFKLVFDCHTNPISPLTSVTLAAATSTSCRTAASASGVTLNAPPAAFPADPPSPPR